MMSSNLNQDAAATSTATTTQATTNESAAGVAAAGATPQKSTTPWNLEHPPAFHCPKLIVKIQDIIVDSLPDHGPDDYLLMSETEIADLDTHECRELTRQLKYNGRVRFQGVRTLSSSGSKVDMQRRIVTWYYCCHRQLQGLSAVPEDYDPSAVVVVVVDHANHHNDTKDAITPGKQAPAKKRKVKDLQEEGDEEEDAVVSVSRSRRGPILPDPEEDVDEAKLKVFASAEAINQLRLDAMQKTREILVQFYDTRRAIFEELHKLDAVIEDATTEPGAILERARTRREMEEASLGNANAMIGNLERNAIVASKRRIL